MTRLRTLPSIAAALLAGAVPGSLAAQIDYRNPDHGRPLRVADAYPIERYAFEVSLPYRLGVGSGGTLHSLAPSLEYGIAPSAMLGVGLRWTPLETGRLRAPGSVAELGGLWNVRRETPSLPALSVAAGLETPIEGAGAGELTVTVRALASRSFGAARLHGNLEWAVGRPRSAGSEHPGRWAAGLAGDWTLFRQSTLLGGEVMAGDDGTGGLAWSLGAGLRRQLTPTLVLFVGLERDLGGDARTGLSLGLSHAFAVAALMPGGGL